MPYQLTVSVKYMSSFWAVADTDGAIAVSTIVLAIITAIGAFLVWRQIVQARRATLQETVRRKKQATMDIYSTSLGSRSEWETLLPADRDSKGLRLLIARTQRSGGEGSRLRSRMKTYLGFWELLAAGVRQDVLDEELLKLLVRDRLIAVATNYQSFISYEQGRFGVSSA